MRYLAKRVERICDELYRLRIVQRIPLTDLICKKGTYIRPEAADAATPPWASMCCCFLTLYYVSKSRT